jgi:hypothetical protein
MKPWFIIRSPVSAFGFRIECFCLEAGLAILGRPRPSTDARPYPRQLGQLAVRPYPHPSPLGQQMSGFGDPLLAQAGTFPLAGC